MPDTDPETRPDTAAPVAARGEERNEERKSASLLQLWGMRVLWLGYYVLLCLLYLRFPRQPAHVELDSSWRRLVAFDFLNNIQAGVDSVFTYGPLESVERCTVCRSRAGEVHVLLARVRRLLLACGPLLAKKPTSSRSSSSRFGGLPWSRLRAAVPRSGGHSGHSSIHPSIEAL